MTDAVRQALYELYALFDLFRRLGHSANDIYFVPQATTDGVTETVGMAVVRDGRTFTATVPIAPEALESVRQAWVPFVERLPQMQQCELQQMWSLATGAPHHMFAIAQGLKSKGLLPDSTLARELTNLNEALHGERAN